MIDLIKSHKTIRKYSDKDVSNEVLNSLLEAGTRASTTGNMQVYSVVVNRDEEMKKRLASCHFNQPMVTQAPVVLTLCADFNRFNLWCEARNAKPGYDNFLSFMTGAIDALLVAQNICLAAESQGMGICYLGTTIYMAEKIVEILELPKGVVPVTTITLGWPTESPVQADRLPLEAIVHQERYQAYTESAIDEIYKKKEQLPENVAFVSENGKQTLAQVFTDVRYKQADNVAFSNLLLNLLKNQGFMNND